MHNLEVNFHYHKKCWDLLNGFSPLKSVKKQITSSDFLQYAVDIIMSAALCISLRMGTELWGRCQNPFAIAGSGVPLFMDKAPVPLVTTYTARCDLPSSRLGQVLTLFINYVHNRASSILGGSLYIPHKPLEFCCHNYYKLWSDSQLSLRLARTCTVCVAS